MVAAVVQLAWFGGSATEPAPTNAEDNAGITFNREDSKAGNSVAAGVPIPTSPATNYSWPKLVALNVTTAGTTTISNRRMSLVSSIGTGLHWLVRGLSAYVQPAQVAADAGSDNVVPALAAPSAAPGLTAGGSGGTWAAATAWVKVTYVGVGGGETLPSAVASVAVAANGTLTIASPPAVAGASGWYAYVGTGASEPADTAKYRQQAAGSPSSLGTSLVLTASPTTSGAVVPTAGTALAWATATQNTPYVYDAAGVSSAATGRNGGFCQMVLSIDSTYQSSGGQSGTPALPQYRITYDES
jgi:hypothetical protein